MQSLVGYGQYGSTGFYSLAHKALTLIEGFSDTGTGCHAFCHAETGYGISTGYLKYNTCIMIPFHVNRPIDSIDYHIIIVY